MENNQLSPDDMELRIKRSMSTVRKKDTGNLFPDLFSDNEALMAFWAKALLLSCIKSKLDKDESGESAGTGDKYLTKLFSDLPLAARFIGNVGFKTPNPLVDTPPLIITDLPASPPDGVVGTDWAGMPMGYFGPSVIITAGRMLIARIVLDGVATTVFEQIAKAPDGAVVRALKTAGIPDETLRLIAGCYYATVSIPLRTLPIHPLSKQVYFEEDGEEEILIQPVTSSSLIESFWNANRNGMPLREIPYGSRMFCRVGGGNPVNGGDLSLSITGGFPLLTAAPPNRYFASLQKTIRSGKPIYNQYAVRKECILTFVKSAPKESSVGNLLERKEEHALYEWFAGVLANQIVEAERLVANDPSLEVADDGAISEFLNRDRTQSIEVGLLERVATAIIVAVAIHAKDLKPFVADPVIHRLLCNYITKELA